MRSANASRAPSLDGALIVATLGVLVIAKLSGIDAFVGSAALSLARDVGGNCDPACMLAGLGAIFGAAGLPTSGHGAESDWQGSRGDHTLPLGAPQAPKSRPIPFFHFYKAYHAAAEFIGGKEKVTSLCAGGISSGSDRMVHGTRVY